MTAAQALALSGWAIFMVALIAIIIAGGMEKPLWVPGWRYREQGKECEEWERLAKQGEKALSSAADTLEGVTLSLQAKLRRTLDTSFDEEELKALCFDIGVEWDQLGGQTKQGKITNLIEHLVRRGNIGALTTWLRINRPDVWRGQR
jgi:hypothetical protein